jgi:DNA-binding HxlR family transcriptional regulator
MAALDLLGRRWTLRVLWELRDGPIGARALRSQCDDMSSSVLYGRLNELLNSGLIRQTEGRDYELTPIGQELGRAIEPLDTWSKKWSRTH